MLADARFLQGCIQAYFNGRGASPLNPERDILVMRGDFIVFSWCCTLMFVP